MKNIELSTEFNNQQTIKIKEFNQYLNNLNIDSPKRGNRRTTKKKSLGGKDEGSDDDELCKQCKRAKNRSLEKRRSSKKPLESIINIDIGNLRA